MKKIRIILIVICILVSFISIPQRCLGQEEENNSGYIRGKVTKLFDNDDMAIQTVEIMILEGSHRGEKYKAQYQLNYSYNGELNLIRLNCDDQVFIDFIESGEGSIEEVFVVQIARDQYLGYLAAGFMFLLIIIGKGKGFKALISLVITILSIVKILLPAILQGYDPIIVTVLLCIGIICISLIIISGLNNKTLAAIIGTTGGVLFAGVVAFYIGTLAKLTGLGQEETQMLIEIPQNLDLNLSGILFSGIIIGTMGATMDVGMSIASAMHEIKLNSPKIRTILLIKAGMNVGRDAMATMANTLILAYTGGAIQLMLLLMAYETPFTQIINWDMIASEVLRALSGSLGIIIAIPLTAIISGIVEKA
ncbi:MAG: YibE/F family protein [Eubacteriales bacterium]